MSSKADKTKDNKEKKSYSPSRKHSSESIYYFFFV